MFSVSFNGLGQERRRRALMAGWAAALAASACSAQAAAPAAPGDEPVNLAIVASASASYVSGDTSLAALNDGQAPQSSRDRSRGSYGNWPRRGVQWVQYEWTRPIRTNRIDVYWWDDRRGVRLPKACRLLYWDGRRFRPVPGASGLGVAGDRFNTTTFDEVTTTKLRLEIESADRYSTGMLEWRVFDSGGSPDFPPMVEAGPDRTAVLGGKTYLEGRVTTLRRSGPLLKTAWTVVAGPGQAAMEDPESLETTAAFSAPGRYELALRAEKGRLAASDRLSVSVLPAPPARPLEPIATRRQRVDSPLWRDRYKAIITRWIPHCVARISDPELKQGGINNFVEAAKKLAGQPHENHRGYVFSNAWVYNTIEAISYALIVDPDGDEEIVQAQRAMQAALDDWIPKILAAQEPDGYLHTAFTLGGWERWTPERRWAHEGYVAGYFLEAAIAHHMATGGRDGRLYEAAKKLADCWCAHIGPPPKKAWYDGHQGMELALVDFGRYVNRREGRGAGDRYLELARFLLDGRGGGQKYDQSHLPCVRQYEAVGHAVRAVYQYTAMAQIAREFGDRDYLGAAMSLWDNIVNRKYYLTGGVGSGETSEGFGPDYSLPHNAYCESCSSCGEIFFQHELNLLWRDARYADLYEETLYNALLGSLDLAGENFYYQNPLDCRRPRYDWHVCPCCVGNIPRTLLRLPSWTYALGEDGLYVNLFVGGEVTIEGLGGTDVAIVQKTDYPWSGEVELTVKPAEPATFALHIRCPRRSVSRLYRSSPNADGIQAIRLNGRAVSPPVEHGYAVIARRWRAGDSVQLALPMPVQRVVGVQQIEATRGQVALRRGPLVYTFESVDQELGKPLAADAPLAALWRPELLHGVMAIRGRWADGAPLLAIPYYARANRFPPREDGGGSRSEVRSTVWVPQAGP